MAFSEYNTLGTGTGDLERQLFAYHRHFGVEPALQTVAPSDFGTGLQGIRQPLCWISTSRNVCAKTTTKFAKTNVNFVLAS